MNLCLNKKPYNNSSILLVGKNFGCGSSREHAPWALLDFGIKCVIGAQALLIFFITTVLKMACCQLS